MTRPDDLLPEGLRDLLPQESARISHLRRAALDLLASHGYARVRPPLIEFEKSLGRRMQGVRTRRMFRFVDPVSLRTLALRSDITPQIGRIAATSMGDAPRPLRLAYCGETALIRADQLDPSRTRTQLGAELIGSDSLAAASELVGLAIEALKAAGPGGISVDFTLPDLVDVLADGALPLADGAREAVRSALDMKDAAGLKLAGGEAYLPLLYASGRIEEALDKLRALEVGGALDSRIEALAALAARLDGKARITLDPCERHGFEYQSWLGFTLYLDGVRGAAGRGGTYAIGGSEEEACGFSLFIDAIAAAMTDQERSDILFLPLGHDEDAAARLRAIGWITIGALNEGDDPAALGCTHVLKGKEAEQL